MRQRSLAFPCLGAAITAVSLVSVACQTPATGVAADSAVVTAWGEPDLQGIWTSEEQVPMERPAKFAGKEFFTDAERAELDKQRSSILRRDLRQETGTEQDVAGAYNSVFQSVRHTGRRTSLVVDPPDGQIPPLTPEAQKRRATIREFQAALLQNTTNCKNDPAACQGGKYGPRSPRRQDPAPFYNTVNLNRASNPEDRSLGERCMGASIPDFSGGQSWGFRQITQSLGQVSMFYDVGQGQGWQRVIPVDGRPHLPSNIRQWWGDPRGHWEGNTLVVDVTNFSPQTDFGGSRENLHLVERWTRMGPDSLEYKVTIEDPTVWTKPWTAIQDMKKQPEEGNRIYREPRCHEGNFGMLGVLAGERTLERAFAAGRGPDPATLGGGGGGGGGEENQDVLQ